MPTANAEFKLKSWNEKAYSEGENIPTLKRAHVEKTFSGDLEGESTLDYLMVYTGEREAAFTGLERFSGKLAGKRGTFVMQRQGTNGADGIVRETFHIVEGSGTGELKGISGHGKWESGHAESYPIEFEYELS